MIFFGEPNNNKYKCKIKTQIAIEGEYIILRYKKYMFYAVTARNKAKKFIPTYSLSIGKEHFHDVLSNEFVFEFDISKKDKNNKLLFFKYKKVKDSYRINKIFDLLEKQLAIFNTNKELLPNINVDLELCKQYVEFNESTRR